jgi:hypothetical protein
MGVFLDPSPQAWFLAAVMVGLLELAVNSGGNSGDDGGTNGPAGFLNPQLGLPKLQPHARRWYLRLAVR